MNDTVEQVTPVIRENRRKFREFCFSLSEDELTRPVPDSTWIVKDFASHLSTLDSLFVGYVGRLERGEQISMTEDAAGAPFDLDAWNDVQVAERRLWSIQQVFDEAALNREALIAAFGRLDEDQVGRLMHFSDPKRGSADFPLKAFLVGWAQHDPIHVADMLKALPERASDATLQAWLANPFVSGYQTAMSSVASA
jgi:hypothetical protein